MKKLSKIIGFTEGLSSFFGGIASGLVAIMMVLVCFEVLMRYVFSKPPLVADEFAGYLLVAVSFFGISQAFLEGSHVRITFLADRLSRKKAQWSRLVILLLSELFVIIMVYSNYDYLSFSIMINERSSSWAHFPLKYPQSTILIGFVVFSIVVLGHILKSIKELIEPNASIES